MSLHFQAANCNADKGSHASLPALFNNDLHPLSSQRSAGWQLNLANTAGLPQEIVFSLKVDFLLVSEREISSS